MKYACFFFVLVNHLRDAIIFDKIQIFNELK